MKKYKHKIIVINSPFKLASFVDIIVFRKNRKKRWTRKRYERILNKIKITFKREDKFLREEDIIPISLLIPDVEEAIIV